jgi:hypothetical protein
MIKRFLLVAAAVCLLVVTGCTGTLSPGMQAGLAKTCQSGTTFYGFVEAAATTEAVKPSILNTSRQAYGILKPLCDKGPDATQTDIVLAAAQAYVLAKAWKDAT